jgi:hypothetical protein
MYCVKSTHLHIQWHKLFEGYCPIVPFDQNDQVNFCQPSWLNFVLTQMTKTLNVCPLVHVNLKKQVNDRQIRRQPHVFDLSEK